MDENLLAARVGVELAARARAVSILYSTLITVNWTCNCSLMLSSVFDDNRLQAMLRCG